MIETIKSNFKRLKQIFFNLHPLIHDIARENYAYNILVKYVPSNYFPITASSLRFNTLQTVLNDIIINNRKCYIEFGSGISTLVVAKFAMINHPKLKIFSVEHDKNWIEIMESFLKSENLTNVTIIHAPLIPSPLSLNHLSWYDTETLDVFCKNNTFDIVLIDGPLAHKKENMLSRYPAIPYLNKKLNMNYSIFLDDANREGEKQILKLWKKEFKIDFLIKNNSYAYAIKGQGFNIFNI